MQGPSAGYYRHRFLQGNACIRCCLITGGNIIAQYQNSKCPLRCELPYKKSNRRGAKKDPLPYNSGNRRLKGLPVTKRAKREYVDEIRPRYRQTESREERGALLDEMAKVTKFNRKYLIRLLHTLKKLRSSPPIIKCFWMCRLKSV